MKTDYLIQNHQKSINLFEESYQKYFSPPVAKFLMNYPSFLNIIQLEHGMGWSPNLSTGSFQMGAYKKDWILHEIGHLIVANKSDLLSPDYGTPLSNQYSFDELVIENKVFRHQKIIQEIIGVPSNKIKSILYIKFQQEQSFKGTSERKAEIYQLTKKAFFDPITQKDKDNTLNKLNETLDYLKQFSSTPTIHFQQKLKITNIFK